MNQYYPLIYKTHRVAIQREKDGKYVADSDFRYYPAHSVMADDNRQPLLLSNDEKFLREEIDIRQINLKNYQLVVVEVETKILYRYDL